MTAINSIDDVSVDSFICIIIIIIIIIGIINISSYIIIIVVVVAEKEFLAALLDGDEEPDELVLEFFLVLQLIPFVQLPNEHL